MKDIAGFSAWRNTGIFGEPLMKKIAVEEHFHTEEYVRYLFTRKEWPRREPVNKGGKRLVRDWWSDEAFRLPAPGPGKIGNLGEERLSRWTRRESTCRSSPSPFPGVEMFGADGTAVARSVNDELAEAIKRFPDRLAGFAAIAPQAPEAAAEELERAVLRTRLGFKGAVVNGRRVTYGANTSTTGEIAG